MKIVKKSRSDVPKEAAHGGSGARRLYLQKGELKNQNLEAMTHGYLPAGKVFDWHDHDGVEEIMFVLKGEGLVSDEDGNYSYKPGDMFVFPPNTQHKISNPTDEEHEMIYLRIIV
jgi:quercetin dioxygenase-like cupin family protein